MTKPELRNELIQRVSEYIYASRKKRGITQEALSELAGCTTPTICCIETGRRLPSVELLVRLAVALDADLNKMVGLTSLEKQ